jgi:hypothetical protein
MLLTAKINFNNIALCYMWLSVGLIYIYQECISLDDYMRLPNNLTHTEDNSDKQTQNSNT